MSEEPNKEPAAGDASRTGDASKPDKAFTLQLWQDVLSKVYVRATVDEAFRKLCLNDPRAAVKEVTPDLVVPDSFRFVFLDQSTDAVYPYLLPPALKSKDKAELPPAVLEMLANWHLQFQTVSGVDPAALPALTGGTIRTMTTGGTQPHITLFTGTSLPCGTSLAAGYGSYFCDPIGGTNNKGGGYR